MFNKHLDYLPLVTIVTPSLNQGRFIKDTIESVLEQNYSKIEYIIIDGGSTDNTISILREYDDRIKWISEKDKGQTEAINKGWRMGKGQILAWLNSDDIYLPGAITHAVDYLNSNQNVIMVYGEGWHIKENGEIIDRYPSEPFNLMRLAETCYICQPTVFFRKELLDKIGYLNEDLNYCMDYDFWIRTAKKYSIGYTNKYLAKSRLYAETKTLGHQVEVCKEVMDTMHNHFGSVALPWIHSYCIALIGKNCQSNTIGELRYILFFAYLFLINYLKYNKKLTRSVFSYCSNMIRKYFASLWNRGGNFHVFF
ncbi:glycosyltransferase [Pelotomaculum terephthalicicum JT]|uniref:glycosyltransferase family 2 protein n=1 Tax=Pelotomaculum terephthalicicum TaxID=206393 RepID=UPI001F04087C|nr:glycosyltransferase family 2 protein [Pelotomaculum terephthalicicum]MCG9966638.1 glycosyltransferase [Pelotomaculum terephthalicicum JT]